MMPIAIALMCQYPTGDFVFGDIVRHWPYTYQLETTEGLIKIRLDSIKTGKFNLPLTFVTKGTNLIVEAKCQMTTQEIK